jgi:DNA polymerase I
MLFAFDTETTPDAWQTDAFPSPHRGAEMFGFSDCTPAGKTNVYRLDRGPLRRMEARNRMQELFVKHTTTLFNSKFDLSFAEKALGWTLPDDLKFHDVQIMCHLLDSDRSRRSLKKLAWELGGYPLDDEKAVKGCRIKDYSKIPERLMDVYQRCDAERTILLHQTMWPHIKKNAKYLDCYKWERKLIRTTMRIEKRGVHISIPQTEEMIVSLERKAQKVYDRICKYVGKPINPDSDMELAPVLFKQLKMESEKKTKGGNQSVDKEVLLNLIQAYPEHATFCDNVLKYRSWTDAASMLKGYLKLTDAEGCLHPSIWTTGARTGRESSDSPNIQNVQKESSPRNVHPVPIRKLFFPRKDHVIFFLDYSGMEMRNLVHYSKDPVMTKAFRAGKDPHKLAMPIWFDEAYLLSLSNEELAILRGACKNVNFAVHYGSGNAKIAMLLQLPIKIINAKRSAYNAAFPGHKTLGISVRTSVMERGCIYTMFGRKIDCPPDKAYMGVNYLIQGSCADILKRAQVNVESYLRHETNAAAEIILPIHDELAIEYPIEHLAKAKKHMREVAKIMCDFPQMRIPLEVECKVTYGSWADAIKYEL